MTSATIQTSKGDIVLDIHDGDAPRAANNFLDLARKGFFDGVIFHRVVPGFVIQGGDPTGTGRGGPGYQFEDEPFSGDYVRGAVAMANAGPNTNGSQFFICLEDLSGRLPKNYTLFGHVTAGMDVVDSIAADPIGPGDRPRDPIAMASVTVADG
jgi:cyclophilin family peptidyl-prolyl cis-trans isomerase